MLDLSSGFCLIQRDRLHQSLQVAVLADYDFLLLPILQDQLLAYRQALA